MKCASEKLQRMRTTVSEWACTSLHLVIPTLMNEVICSRYFNIRPRRMTRKLYNEWKDDIKWRMTYVISLTSLQIYVPMWTFWFPGIAKDTQSEKQCSKTHFNFRVLTNLFVWEKVCCLHGSEVWKTWLRSLDTTLFKAVGIRMKVGFHPCQLKLQNLPLQACT